MIIAIIPALNEEDTIGSIVLKTRRQVDKVIVVDDGSIDKTAIVAKLAGADVIKHVQNGGKGSALKTGFEFARKINPDVIVCLDADAQHNPDDIPKVIAPIISGEADMVIASRYLNKEHRKIIPKYRRFGLWVLTSTMNFGSKNKITDSQSGFRAFYKDTFDIFRFQQNGLNVESEMLEDAMDNDIKIKEVPISIRYEGLATSSEKPSKHGLGVLSFILRAVKERHPLLFFGVSGAVLLLIGLGFGVYCLDWYFKYDSLPFGPSLAASVLILMGALCLFSGLILNSISGMIQGPNKLVPVRKETSAKNLDEKMIQMQNPLNLHRRGTLIDGMDEKITQRQTSLNLYRGGTLVRNTGENKTQDLSLMNLSDKGVLTGDSFEKKINGQIPLDLPERRLSLEYTGDKNIQLATSTSIMSSNGLRNYYRHTFKDNPDVSEDIDL